MYDELKERCRSCSQGCIDPSECSYFDKPPLRCMRQLLSEAADAIESLEADKAALNGTVTNLLGQIKDLGKPRWIPVTERLPKYGERVLVFGGVTMYVAYYDKNRYGGESWHKLNSKSHHCNPTHWMPLPEPPKEE